MAGLSRGDVVRAAVVGMVGITLDTYDLTIGTIAAALVFSKVFFPPSADPAAAAAYSFLAGTTAALAFRVLGAFLFGHVGDRLGRRVALTWDLVFTGLGSLVVGLAPDHASAGYLGLAMVLLGRILVGIGLGGEAGGAVTLVVEQAHAAGSRWRAFWAAVSWIGWTVAAVMASSIMAWLSALYPGDAFYSFGWRIAFYVGAAAALVGVALRWILLESAMFEEAARAVGVSRAPAVEVFRYWRPILGMLFPYALGNVLYNIWTSYALTYATGVGVPRQQVLLTVTLGSALQLAWFLANGLIADVVGRRPVLLASTVLAVPASAAWPLLVLTGDFRMLMLAQVLLMLTNGALNGTAIALGAESFPTRYRYSGTSHGIQLAVAVGAGIAIPAMAGLIGTAYAERWWIVPAITSAYAALSLAAILLLTRETAGEKLAH